MKGQLQISVIKKWWLKNGLSQLRSALAIMYTDAMVTIKQKCEIHKGDTIYSPIYSVMKSCCKGDENDH